jgi:hypothetical protein
VVAFTEQWLELWRQTAAWWPGGLAAAAFLLQTRRLQRRWLSDLSRTTDQMLRSPELVELTRQTVTALAGGPMLPPTPRREESPDDHRRPSSD